MSSTKQILQAQASQLQSTPTDDRQLLIHAKGRVFLRDLTFDGKNYYCVFGPEIFNRCENAGYLALSYMEVYKLGWRLNMHDFTSDNVIDANTFVKFTVTPDGMFVSKEVI